MRPGEPASRRPPPEDPPDSDGALDAPPESGSEGAEDGFAGILRELARAAPVMPDELAAAIARGDLVGRLVGRFRVLEKLGSGGMGVVYGAEDTKLGRRVALKVLAPRAAGARERSPASGTHEIDVLLREARAAAAITHPNVAAIYEAGEADGVAHIAMEYVDGVTLRARLAPGPLPLVDAVRYARQIADGLAKAHERGVVHRDLKPDNVMIDRDDRIKILDFGLARPLANALAGDADRDSVNVPSSRRGRPRVGTPAYMSPEQVQGGRVDARSDVFSFGVLLYEALTGATPFDRAGPPGSWTFDRDATNSALRAAAPSAWCKLVDRCLAVPRAARFADGTALVQAIDAALAASDDKPRRARRSVAWGFAVGGLALLGAVAAWRAHSPAREAHDGPALRRLTANIPENPILSAALSPDGETLAYIDKLGLNLGKAGGAAAPVDLGVSAAPQIVAWFPDGQRLAVCTAAPGASDEDLWVVSRARGAKPRLIAHGPFTGIAVSPDGARIAFAANDSVGWLDAVGPAELHPLKKNDGCFISEVAWSPDAARIAYASLCFDSLASTAIETVALNGGAPSVVVADPHLYSSFVRAAGVLWSTSGEIVYPRTEWLPAEPGSNLWSVKVDPRTGARTGPPHPITSWVGVGAAALSASTSGARTAFIRFDTQSDVYVGDLSNGGRTLSPPRRLTLTDRNERPAAWSKDGRGVYFFSDASGNFDILFQSIDGGLAHSFAAEPAWETASQLSPDGDALLYWRFPAVVSDEAIHPELVRRAVVGGPAIHVLTADSLAHPAGAGRPAPWEMRMRCPKQAGLACILSERYGDALVFTSFDPSGAGGRGKEVFRVEHPTGASTIWDISPDGTRLAIPRANGPILLQPIAGGSAPAEVSIPGCDPVTPTWSADGRGLFVSVDCNAEDATFRLYYVGLDGVATLLWKDASLYILEAEASPDGAHLAIAVKHSDDDVWMIDGSGGGSAGRKP